MKPTITTTATVPATAPAVVEATTAVSASEKTSPGKTGQSVSAPVSSSASAMETTPPQPVVYYGYDSNETVPHDMCLVGCIFYMGDYIKTDPCDQWTKVSNNVSFLCYWCVRSTESEFRAYICISSMSSTKSMFPQNLAEEKFRFSLIDAKSVL